MLEEYRSSLVNDTARLFTSRSACTGFSTELIEAVVEHSKHIFDLAYINTFQYSEHDMQEKFY